MRKILGIIVIALTFLLVSCEKVDPFELMEEELEITYLGVNDNLDNVTLNIELKTESKLYKDAIIAWESSNESALKINDNVGVVTRGEVDIVVTLTLSITYKEETKDFEYELTIIKIENNEEFDFDAIFNQINLPNSTTTNLTLPTEIDGITITWESSNEDVITNSGVVTRGSDDVTVTLTARATKDEEFETKDYVVTVEKLEEEVDFDALFNKINIPEVTINDIILPSELDEFFITWSSNNDAVINNNGVVVRSNVDTLVVLTATATKGSKEDSRTFTVKVLKTVSAPVSTKTPIVEILELTKGTSVTVHGVVTSLMTNGNFTIQDSTGAIPVYMSNNTGLNIGTEYIISGKMDEFNGLVQIGSPKIDQTIGTVELPDVIELSHYSLDFEDITFYNGYVVNYENLEVTSKATPNNAYELYLKNDRGETGMVRLDTRVNTNNPFLNVSVGEIISLKNVTVGEYQEKAQFLFTNRSEITVRPKDPNQPNIVGAKNITHIIGDDAPNYLEGVTASNANGVNYTSSLVVDSSRVNLNTYGSYEVTISLSVAEYNIQTTIIVYVRNEAQIGVYEGYYASLSGLVGSDFNNELARLIRNTGSATGSTSQVKQVDFFNGQNYNIYTGFGGYGNREHVWPNSKLGSAPDYDLHNLRAAVVSVNTSRSNHPFVENNKPFTGTASYQKIGSGWYPGDEHIGDVARIVLYIHVRYNLNINLVGNLQMFLNWHELDPVSEFELSRNDKIQNIQNNRNPFIDHPELVGLYF